MNLGEAVGWGFVGSGPAGTSAGIAPPYLYYGDVETLTRYGAEGDGPGGYFVWGPPVVLPELLYSDLRFELWKNTEPVSDVLEIWVEDEAGTRFGLEEILEQHLVWTTETADLSAFAGETVRVGFRFVVDAAVFTGHDSQAYHGVFLDDVAIRSTCTPPACLTDADCGEPACVQARCLDGLCAFTRPVSCCGYDSDCDDGEPCTSDVCNNGACRHYTIEECCESDAECDDDDLCTTDACAQGPWLYPICVQTPVAGCCSDDGDCDDGDPCTNDHCPAPGDLCENTEIDGCCRSSVDCTDADACTRDLCVDHRCEHDNVCCEADVDCDDGDDRCTIDRCLDQHCVYEASGAEGCCDSGLLVTDWGDGAFDDFLVDNQHPPIGWNLVEEGPDANDWLGVAPPFAYYGDPATLANYGSGDLGSTARGHALVPRSSPSRLASRSRSLSICG